MNSKPGRKGDMQWNDYLLQVINYLCNEHEVARTGLIFKYVQLNAGCITPKRHKINNKLTIMAERGLIERVGMLGNEILWKVRNTNWKELQEVANGHSNT